MKNYVRWGLAAGAVFAALYGAGAQAQTVTIGSATGQPGNTVSIPVTFTQGAGNAAGYQTRFTYNTAAFGVPTVQAGATATCSVNDALGEISVIRFTFPAAVLANETACTINFPIEAAAPLATYPLNHAAGQPRYSNTVGAEFDATGVNGQIVVSAAAVPLTLSYAPVAGSTITFAAGANVGAAAPNQTIAVTATGTSGTATLTGCAITGAGAAAFSVNPTSLNFAAAGTQNLTVGCTHQAAAATATLACTETDGDTAAPGASRSWSLSCPAGNVPNVNPTITSNPAAGGALTVTGGLVGNQGTGTIDFTAAGGSGSGSTTINCTSTGTVVIALSPATPAGTTANQTVTGSNAAVDVRVGVLLTSAAQTPAGTVSCNITPFGGATTTSVFTINAPAGSVFTPPEVIPSASTWSKIALFGLLGLFGMLAVGFRRQG